MISNSPYIFFLSFLFETKEFIPMRNNQQKSPYIFHSKIVGMEDMYA